MVKMSYLGGKERKGGKNGAARLGGGDYDDVDDGDEDDEES